VLAENVRESLKLLMRRDEVRIAIHPTQIGTLRELLPRLNLDWPGLQGVEMMEDASIAPGGCRVTAGQGEIDADLQHQLDRIAAVLIPDHDGGGE
jgi:flagellar assembly protein FliH